MTRKPARRSLSKRNTARGFSLLELSLVLALLAGVAIILLPAPENDPGFVEEESVLEVADKQLIYFIASQSRLPCPDYDRDGFEDCAGSGKGRLPFRTLGMNSAGYGLNDMPLRYSVYRQPSNSLISGASGGAAFVEDADLAAHRDRFEPRMANDQWLSFNNASAADFCAALEAGERKPFNAGRTHLRDGAGNRNVAYALASPGRYDGDGDDNLFDGFNGTNSLGFNSDTAAISGAYDDRVRSRTFAELRHVLQCDELIRSLNLIANARQTEIEVSDTLSDNQASTIIGSFLNYVALSFNAVDLVETGFAVYDASTHLAAATSALSTAIASCAILVGCGFIPTTAAAVAAATAALVAASASVVAAAVSAAGQAITTAMYISAAVQAGITDLEFENPDMSEAISSLEQRIIEEREGTEGEDGQAGKKGVDELEAELAAARDKESELKNKADSGFAALKDYVAVHGDPEASGTPEVVSLTQTAIGREKSMFEARFLYEEKKRIYDDAQARCDQLTNSDLNDVDTSEMEDMDNIDLDQVKGADVGEQQTKACQESAEAEDAMDAAWSALTTARNNRMDAILDAVVAGKEFQIPDGVDEEGNKQFKACEDVTSCKLDTQISQVVDEEGEDVELGIVPDYGRYYLQRDQVASLEDQVNEKRNVIAELEMSLAAMTCVQDGQHYNEATGTCGPADQVEPGAESSISVGGEDILRAVDGRHLVQ